MSELRGWRVNAGVEEDLLSGENYIPDMGKESPFQGPPPYGMLIDEALEIGDDRATAGGRIWMSYEVIL